MVMPMAKIQGLNKNRPAMGIIVLSANHQNRPSSLPLRPSGDLQLLNLKIASVKGKRYVRHRRPIIQT